MSAGFLSLNGIIHFPYLGSTSGLGGVNAEVYPFPEEPDTFQEGVGTGTTIQAFSRARAPKTVIIRTVDPKKKG